MKKTLILLFLLFPFLKTEGQVRIITTIAGTDSAGYSGDGGPAINAKLYYCYQHCSDKSGNLLIADAFNHRIRKIDVTTGIITTVVGTGVGGYNGDWIQATDAQLFVPCGVGIDERGNIYISDALNYRIRKVDISSGLITTIAGNGTLGFSGNNTPAIHAKIDAPSGICVDKANNVYFADFNNHVVRVIVDSTGVIRTVAGRAPLQGYLGDGGPAIKAKLNSPADIAFDNSGNLFICDAYNHAIRKVDTAGIITTIGGNGTASYSGHGVPATNAGFNCPFGIYIDKGDNIFIADCGNGAIRRIDRMTGIIASVAGIGVRGFAGDGGPATNAKLEPTDVSVDSCGTMYITDYMNHRIRKVYDPTLGIPKTIEKHCKLYPNPAHHEVTIEHAKGHTLRIYDVTGRKVMEGQVSSDKETIAIAQLNSGVYVVQVTNGDGMQELIQLLVN